MSQIVVITSAHTAFDPRITLKQCRSLRDAGYAVTLIVPHDRDETWEGVRIKAIPSGGRFQRFTSNLWRIYRVALKGKADIYHLHDPELLLVAVLLKLTTAGKIVFDAHEDYPNVVLRRYWIPKPGRLLAHTMTKLFLRLTLPFCDGVVSATEEISNGLRHPNKVVVKNYVRLKPVDNGHIHATDLLVYAGTVSEERGLSYFLSAFRKIRETIPIRLRLVGIRGEEEMIQQLVRDCPPGSVETFSYMPQSQALALIGEGTLGLLLDLSWPGNDGPPTKLFEYMALGLPVVGCDLPTARQIIEDARCGIIVDFRDTEAVASRIIALLRDSAEVEEMRKRGFIACKKYQWDDEAKKLIDLYQDLAGKKQQKGRALSAKAGT